MTDGREPPGAAGMTAPAVGIGIPDHKNAIAARTARGRGIIGISPFLPEARRGRV